MAGVEPGLIPWVDLGSARGRTTGPAGTARVRAMTTTAPARPLSDPHTRGLHLGRSAVMAVLRCAALMVVSLLYGWSISPSADPVGAGLVGFMLTVALATVWSVVDGWRRPLRTGVAAWVLTAALLVVLAPLPGILTYPADEGGWTSLADYLAMTADGAGFMFALVAVPALAGLGGGHLIRVGGRSVSPTASSGQPRTPRS